MKTPRKVCYIIYQFLFPFLLCKITFPPYGNVNKKIEYSVIVFMQQKWWLKVKLSSQSCLEFLEHQKGFKRWYDVLHVISSRCHIVDMSHISVWHCWQVPTLTVDMYPLSKVLESRQDVTQGGHQWGTCQLSVWEPANNVRHWCGTYQQYDILTM